MDEVVRAVQRAFPLIYFACHRRHQPKGKGAPTLTARAERVLAHLSPDRPKTPTQLAQHLHLQRSTISDVIKELQEAGLVRRRRSERDGRSMSLLLTDEGEAVLGAESVLDASSLQALLRHLSAPQREVVRQAFVALADACARGATR